MIGRLRPVPAAAVAVLLAVVAGCALPTSDPWAGTGDRPTPTRFERDTRSDFDRHVDAMLRSGDPDNPNVKVTLVRLELDERRARALAARVRYDDGDVRAGAGSPDPGGGGLRAGWTDGNWRAAVRLSGQDSRTTRTTEAFIVTMDGHPASLQVSETVDVGRFRVIVDDEDLVFTELEQAGVFLDVLPRVTRREGGRDTITVRLTPVLSRAGATAGTIEVTSLATTVTVPNGGTVVLGGLTGGEDAVVSALLGRSRERVDRRTVLMLTVRILD